MWNMKGKTLKIISETILIVYIYWSGSKKTRCWTINSNRKKLPVFKPDNNFNKGDSERYSCNNGVAVWKLKSNRCIHLATNYHDPDQLTFVKKKDKRGLLTQWLVLMFLKVLTAMCTQLIHFIKTNHCAKLTKIIKLKKMVKLIK